MSAVEPGRDCHLCPRLVTFRETWREREPDWFNAPVASFGPKNARLLVVGLAPGLRGANRTGRPFTGDGAGNLLYPTLLDTRFARGQFEARPDDGLKLIDCRITNAVRCVPPENKPVGAEIRACNPFLSEEIADLPKLQVILALGGIAHNAVLDALKVKRSSAKFGHAADHVLENGLRLVDSYHCSRLNTNTGRLTPAMFSGVFETIRDSLNS
ncbi:MAG: uracil-DNA glycosylase [Alphaproteobacteria bacterium]|nr:uracil-DNA glycosylase [Rhodospirillaceae bacterium]MBT6205414.1 uracil-DNA glycosylase [Rhodospirillaceae bacterium]MBT7647115.1 uracil-DNA glycosylase [Rhodospirillaceae bacterium]MDG2482547.1 uracil-DNA glycosylase [Alphaproteobacteria bacterium]